MSAARVSPEVMRQLVQYEPDTGRMFWLRRSERWFKDGRQSAAHNCAIWNGKYAGLEAMNYRKAGSSSTGGGYLVGNMMGRVYRSHHVAFVLFYGRWPTLDIDHINRVRTDNRITNLREVTRSENLRNVGSRANSTSKVRGVCWAKERSQWNARINTGERYKNLGYFDDERDAIAARLNAEAKYWGHPTDTFLMKLAIMAAQGVEVVLV